MNKTNSRWKKTATCLLILGLAVIITVSSSCAASGTIYVSTQGNNAWNGLSATYDPTTGNGPKATIANAIDTVADNGTVNVAAGTYKENLIIYKNVNLIGVGPDSTIIDGNQAGSVLSFYGATMENAVTAFTLTLNGFTLTNGLSTTGGGIYNMGGIIFLTNTKITNNIVTSSGSGSNATGGGLYNAGTVYADSSTIISGNYHTSISGNVPDNVAGYPVIYLTSSDMSQDLILPIQ